MSNRPDPAEIERKKDQFYQRYTSDGTCNCARLAREININPKQARLWAKEIDKNERQKYSEWISSVKLYA